MKFVITFAVLLGVSSVRAQPSAQGSCEYNNRRYLNGTRFDSIDGCNTCFCQDGNVGCTEMACGPICAAVLCEIPDCPRGQRFTPPDQCCPQCRVPCDVGDGKVYYPGDSVPSGDCNTCACSDGGQVICTLIACGPDCSTVRCAAPDCPVELRFTPTGKCCQQCRVCKYGGQTYQVDETFPAGDGCNTCSCTRTGVAACTKRACAPKCQYNGKTYSVGERFKSVDGCNTCFCTSSGQVGCTRKYCPPPCPVYKCKHCPSGYLKDRNGCQTCRCRPILCGWRICKKDEFCSGGECCPNRVKNQRCRDPCRLKYCGWWARCQRYCGCSARCVPFFQWWRFNKK